MDEGWGHHEGGLKGTLSSEEFIQCLTSRETSLVRQWGHFKHLPSQLYHSSWAGDHQVPAWTDAPQWSFQTEAWLPCTQLCEAWQTKYHEMSKTSATDCLKTSSQYGIDFIRAVPEIILGGGGGNIFFPDPSTPPGHTWSQSLPTPRTLSVLINPAPLWIKYALTPRTSYRPTPPTFGHIINKTPSPPQDKKVPVAHPPQIISGTALTGSTFKWMVQEFQTHTWSFGGHSYAKHNEHPLDKILLTRVTTQVEEQRLSAVISLIVGCNTFYLLSWTEVHTSLHTSIKPLLSYFT